MLAEDDLKKPLRVSFEGEEGVDEGGVQKEYFQVHTAPLPRVRLWVSLDTQQFLMFSAHRALH